MPALQPSIRGASDVSQAQTFEHILLFLRRLARLAPLALIVEDLHWADRTTLDFLLLAVRNLRDEPIAVVGSYRNDELHRRHPLQPVLAELERSGRAERVALERFDRQELAAQLEGIRGSEPDQDLVDSIHARSEGNAFFAEELAAAGDSGMSDSLQDLLLARFTSLSDATQDVLRIAAVAGLQFGVALLQVATSIEPAALYRAIRDGVDAHILVPLGDEQGDRYAFRHALVQEAIYQDLLPGQRTTLHEAFAAALEEAGDGEEAGRAAALAYHWAAAHDLGRAFEASVQAAIAAESIHATADARASYERALDLWDRVPDAASRSPLDRIDLLAHAAQTAAGPAQVIAIERLRAAIDLADRTDDPERRALLRAFLCAILAIWDDEAALDVILEAQAIVADRPASPARARVLFTYGQLLNNLDRHRDALPVLAEAMDVARAAPVRTEPGILQRHGLDLALPSRIESLAIEQTGRALVSIGELVRGLERLDDSQELAQRLGIISRANEAWFWRAHLLVEAGRFEAAIEQGVRGSAHADANGLAGMQGVLNLVFVGEALVALGRWQEASEVYARMERQSTHSFAVLLDGRVAALEVGRGDFPGAARRLGRLRGVAERLQTPALVGPFVAADAEMALWKAEPGAARSIVRQGLARIEGGPDIWIGNPGSLLALGLRAEADLPDAERSQEAGRDALHRMRELASATAHDRPLYTPQAEAWLALCEAELSRLERRSDPDGWATAASAWERLGMPYPRAYALWRTAQSIVAGRGDRARAAAAVREAAEIAARLGARPLQERADDLATRLGIRQAPAVVAGGAQGRGRDDLTARELEVLQLMVGGRSDGEIASSLFISKKTVSVHVNNIKGKLGAESRVHIVTTALARGLVPQAR